MDFDQWTESPERLRPAAVMNDFLGAGQFLRPMARSTAQVGNRAAGNTGAMRVRQATPPAGGRAVAPPPRVNAEAQNRARQPQETQAPDAVERRTTGERTRRVADTGATAPRQAESAAQAATPTRQANRYVVQDKAALIRTPPEYKSTGQSIPFGTAVEEVESIRVGNATYMHVRQVNGAGDWWTAASNLKAVTRPIDAASINSENLTIASNAAVAVAPTAIAVNAGTGIPLILRQAAELGVRDANQVAYMLATAEHESKFGARNYDRSESLVEDRNPFRQQRDGSWSATNHVSGRRVSAATEDELETAYWDDAYGGRLGNARGTTDARNFRGRGYVQITGRDNYQKMSGVLTAQNFQYTVDGVTYGTRQNPIDLAAHPDHVNRVPALAARLLAEGSVQGHYTGRRLNEFINNQGTDFTNARRVINGDTATNGASIAAIARRYATALLTDNRWANVFQPAQRSAAQSAPSAPRQAR